MKKGYSLISVFVIVLTFTIITSIILGAIFSGKTGNVAMIPVEGVISTGSYSFGATASSFEIVNNNG